MANRPSRDSPLSGMGVVRLPLGAIWFPPQRYWRSALALVWGTGELHTGVTKGDDYVP